MIMNVLRDGSKIISYGFSDYDPKGNEVVESVTYNEFAPPSWIGKAKRTLLWDNSQPASKEIVLKPENQIKIEKINSLTNSLFRSFAWIMDIWNFTKKCLDEGDDVNDSPMTMNDLNNWKSFFKELRKIVKDLKNVSPKLRDGSSLDDINIENIYIGNLKIFPQIPPIPNGDYDYSI